MAYDLFGIFCVLKECFGKCLQMKMQGKQFVTPSRWCFFYSFHEHINFITQKASIHQHIL